ncbi:3-keto-disaccharide hydrolase [Gayadomonas joobiniege]|uniref:3-keto-disaccharide hydrolase n=1 Tax=Gayadomonas joobiniege TaxID=1234606 RepID=UPI000364FC4F|nr:DUF1080 domain-containing protein [Gayadomonas joobiniege]
MQKFFLICLLFLTTNSHANEWRYLLDKELSQWEIWMGVPHSSVTDLPANTFKADNLNQHGDPADAIGLDQDPKAVFNSYTEMGQPALHITGEVYGGLTSKKSFKNYHLSLKVKWGTKKWAPRLNAKRDSGLLFHCYGPHGAFWKVWKACHELQIQESDFGDYIPLAGPTAKVRGHWVGDKYLTFNEADTQLHLATGYTHAQSEPDFERGRWNQVELFTLNDKAVFVVNDTIVMAIQDSKDQAGRLLNQGQIQIQSEGAEAFFTDIKIRPIQDWPNFIKRKNLFK